MKIFLGKIFKKSFYLQKPHFPKEKTKDIDIGRLEAVMRWNKYVLDKLTRFIFEFFKIIIYDNNGFNVVNYIFWRFS